MPLNTTGRGWWRRLIVTDYYLASLLLLVAGLLKARHAGVSELLQSFLDQGILPLSVILAVSRWQAGFEIVLALVALSGWRPMWCAKGVAFLYLVFAAMIAIAADGYWFEPLDCGCFGSGAAHTPAYLLIVRNIVIALPLLFADPGLADSLLFGRRSLPSAH